MGWTEIVLGGGKKASGLRGNCQAEIETGLLLCTAELDVGKDTLKTRQNPDGTRDPMRLKLNNDGSYTILDDGGGDKVLVKETANYVKEYLRKGR